MAVVLASTEDIDYADWLDLRKKGIGGSDASVVCGINKWKSPIELWMEKTDQLPYQEAGEAAYWGTQLESLVRNEFTKRTGIEVIPVNQLLQSEDHPFMLANLDGVCQHPNYGTCIFEAKTSSAYRETEWSDTIPDEYTLQIQHYLAVTGYMGAYIAVLIWKPSSGVMFNLPYPRRWMDRRRQLSSSTSVSPIVSLCPRSSYRAMPRPLSKNMKPPLKASIITPN
jgi:putative phage-type endonuclease